jgi:hypothetical protein
MRANAVGFSTFEDLLPRSNCCQTKSSSALLSSSGASTLSPFEREEPEVDAEDSLCCRALYLLNLSFRPEFFFNFL